MAVSIDSSSLQDRVDENSDVRVYDQGSRYHSLVQHFEFDVRDHHRHDIPPGDNQV